ncbi:hypothetical protein BKA70DRAFT_1246554 [Coprinopsis sp. MPI-PUGE-AT-0042]|nr:hypothetical protein BKA70DRAFT_1246554 [Coprinopsis sp. MPI-PUGE-AT-0042]
MTAHPAFPNEILDAIVDSAFQDLSTPTVFGVTFTIELVTLLKEVALTSRYLRERAQRYLFLEIRLHPFKRRNREYEDDVPQTVDLSIFQNNPRLLEYPRSLAIIVQARDWRSEFSPHFLSVAFPFFANNLRKLAHLDIHLNHHRQWTSLPSECQDSIVKCLKDNSLRSLKLRRLSLPERFDGILPSTLKACHFGVYAEDDPTFAEKYIEPRRNTGSDQANTVSPIHLKISSLSDDPMLSWVPSQANTFFQRIKYLEVGVRSIIAFAAFMNRIPNALTHLSLLHRDDARVLHRQHSALQSTTLPSMPYLKVLMVSITIKYERSIRCPDYVAMIARDYISLAYTSIHAFHLTIEWKSSPGIHGPPGPAARYLERTPDGFARLDDLLSDRSSLGSLREVKLDIRPAYQIGGGLISELQARIQGEALEVFHKTINRVDSFSVMTADAFKY